MYHPTRAALDELPNSYRGWKLHHGFNCGTKMFEIKLVAYRQGMGHIFFNAEVLSATGSDVFDRFKELCNKVDEHRKNGFVVYGRRGEQ